jgi:carboxypeptidase Taq
MSKKLDDLKSQLEKIAFLGSAISLLQWDQQVNMPMGGGAYRGDQTGFLEGLLHKMKTGDEFKQALNKLINLDTGEILEGLKEDLKEEERVLIYEVWRDWNTSQALPGEFVEEFSKAQTASFIAWQEAKRKDDFDLFAPHLKKIIQLSKQKATFYNPNILKYDALIDRYEPYMTQAKIDQIFGELKFEVKGLLSEIEMKKVDFHGLKEKSWEKPSQERFIEYVIRDLGYDWNCGRQDFSEHPFSISFHPTDSRITTHIKEKDLLFGLLASIHECGHALYEQGLNKEWFGTPLGEAASFGIHESQSRFYETRIGMSKPFWDRYYPILKSHFYSQLKDISKEDFYKSLNRVVPGVIRLDADELTYNLHIIIRYEMEKEMMEKDLEPHEISNLWDTKYEEILGLRAQKPSEGILQDVHWAEGYIGYFPSYVLGCVYASMIYEKMLKDMPDMEKDIAKGEFALIREWLRKNIHSKGRFKKPLELVEEVTEEKITIKPYVDYLRKKYGEIYSF